MPLLKTIHKRLAQKHDITIYRDEWEATLKAADYDPELQCWLAIDCIFGKRRNEICQLIYRDITVEPPDIVIRFHPGKKKRKRLLTDYDPYLKRKTLFHYAVPYILNYLTAYETMHSQEKDWESHYLFPSNRQASEVTIHTPYKNKAGQIVMGQYRYPVKGGYKSGSYFYNQIKKVNPLIWPHLARHTVATEAAGKGASQFDVAKLLDVDPQTALAYIHGGTKGFMEQWSKQNE